MHMRVAAVGCRPLAVGCCLLAVDCGTRSTAKTFALVRRCCCEDDVPEWIDKGFVINEKQVAYESKKRKDREKYVCRCEAGLADWLTDRSSNTLTVRRCYPVVDYYWADIFVNDNALNFDVHAFVFSH